MITPVRVSLIIATVVTVLYWFVVWYAGNLFTLLLSPDGAENISRLSVWAILPLDISLSYNMIHWQLLATISLGYCCYAMLKPKPGDEANRALPLVNHYAVLFGFMLFHLIGFGINMLCIGYTLV